MLETDGLLQGDALRAMRCGWAMGINIGWKPSEKEKE